MSNRSLREQEGAAASPPTPENAKPRRARRENARTHRELLALLDDTMKLPKDPSEQEEQVRRERRSRKNEKQRGAARAATIAFSSDEWDEMLGAGWSVKASSSLLVGAGYVLAPWRQNQNIRQLRGLEEGKDTGFWV